MSNRTQAERDYDKDWYRRNKARALAKGAAWKEANREKVRAYSKVWRRKNRHKIRAAARARYREDLEKSRANRRSDYAKSGRKRYQTGSYYVIAKLNAARQRAERSGLPFDLIASDVVIPSVCPVLGVPLVVGKGREFAPTIDRIDNSKGYTRDNVAVISGRASLIKRDATIDELRKILAYMEAHELCS